MPVRFYQYDTHIEIMNPSGLYGEARPENFPNVNDYRNSVLAEMMRTMNYVNMFNHGVREVQTLLKENGNEEARFDVNLLTAFRVYVSEAIDLVESFSPVTIHQLSMNCSVRVKELIVNMQDTESSLKELQLFTNCSPKSKSLFIEQFVAPALELGLIAQTHPNSPHHPRQKYYLTEKGKAVLEQIKRQ